MPLRPVSMTTLINVNDGAEYYQLWLQVLFIYEMDYR